MCSVIGPPLSPNYNGSVKKTKLPFSLFPWFDLILPIEKAQDCWLNLTRNLFRRRFFHRQFPIEFVFGQIFLRFDQFFLWLDQIFFDRKESTFQQNLFRLFRYFFDARQSTFFFWFSFRIRIRIFLSAIWQSIFVNFERCRFPAADDVGGIFDEVRPVQGQIESMRSRTRILFVAC